MNLTKRQKEIVFDIYNGAVFICDSCVKGAWVSGGKLSKDYHINNGVFFRLVNKGIIYQQQSPPFNYILSEKCVQWMRNRMKE